MNGNEPNKKGKIVTNFELRRTQRLVHDLFPGISGNERIRTDTNGNANWFFIIFLMKNSNYEKKPKGLYITYS